VIGDADDTALGYSKGDKERKGGAEGEESGVAGKKRARGVREEGDGADAGDVEVDDRRARLKTGKAEDGARAAGKGGGGLGRKAGDRAPVCAEFKTYNFSASRVQHVQCCLCA